MRTTIEKPQVLGVLERADGPLGLPEVARALSLGPRTHPALGRVLDDLLLEGRVGYERGHYFLANAEPRAGRRVGILSMSRRGFGFVGVPGRGGAGVDDVFIPEGNVGGALHGDLVEIAPPVRAPRGFESAIQRVVERRSPLVSGTLRRRGRSAWLEPDDGRLRSPVVVERASFQAADRDVEGQAAVVRITRWPERADELAECVIEKLLGEPGAPEVELARILASHAIEEGYPEDAVVEARAYGTEPSPEMREGRDDLTGVPLITIDPEDARDHDDAVHVERLEQGGYRASIAVADVSAYVRPGTALDREAARRATSVYLPDRAVPMLPPELSTHLCSLVPGEDRLCLAVIVELSPDGTVNGSRITRGVMRSGAKLSYGAVARALGWTELEPEREEATRRVEDLRVADEVSRLLRAQRLRRGALDLDLPEPKIAIDPETKQPTSITQRTHDPGVRRAYQLIEELMLLANEVVANVLEQREIPAVYRVHGKPDETKLDRFAAYLDLLDIPFEASEIMEPKLLSKFLKRIGKRPDRGMIHSLLLRAMKQAVYDVHNVGHFGLASGAYLHFTSPIRRYPDLLVHRAVTAMLVGLPADRSPDAVEALATHARVSSDRERNAMEAEREAVDLYRALYLSGHVGDVYQGRVVAITSTGVVVSVDEPFVDLLVRFEALPGDRWQPDESGIRLVGLRSGAEIRLGSEATVEVEDVSLARRAAFGRALSVGGSEARPRRGERSDSYPSAGPRGGARGSPPRPGARRTLPSSDRGRPGGGRSGFGGTARGAPPAAQPRDAGGADGARRPGAARPGNPGRVAHENGPGDAERGRPRPARPEPAAPPKRHEGKTWSVRDERPAKKAVKKQRTTKKK